MVQRRDMDCCYVRPVNRGYIDVWISLSNDILEVLCLKYQMGVSRKHHSLSSDMLIQNGYYFLTLVLGCVVLLPRHHVEAIYRPGSIATSIATGIQQSSILWRCHSHLHVLLSICSSCPFIDINGSVLSVNALLVGKRIVHEQNQGLVLSLLHNALKPSPCLQLFRFLSIWVISVILNIKIVNVAPSSRNSLTPIVLSGKGHEREHKISINY